MRRSLYTLEDLAFGFEIEVGDVDRGLKIPESIGSWEYSERDIVNLCSPYRYRAVDPLGISPPVGGEINLVPSRSIDTQQKRAIELLHFFRDNGQEPTACCTAHTHLHVSVNNLCSDLAALKRLHRFISANQDLLIDTAGGFVKDDTMTAIPGVTQYLKMDGGRPIPPWMVDNICGKAKSFEDVINIQRYGKDMGAAGRPFRYAVNTYCLKHTGTIEFRPFRATLEAKAFKAILKTCASFILAALNDTDEFTKTIKRVKNDLPPFRFCKHECAGWASTKWDQSRGRKVRNRLEPVG